MAPKAPTLPSAEEIGKLVPIGRIAKDTPYSADFLRQLARSGKIRAFKLNRDWLTTPNAIRDYLKTQTKRHEKALSLLQSAEKAFLALTLLLIVFSATPKARAEGLANPPPHESTMSAILHKLTSSFFGKPNDSVTTITYPNPRLVSISSEDVGTGNVFSSKFSISATLHDLKTSWHNFDSFYGQELSAVGTRLNTALLTLGQALLGKTTEEYLADAPARIFALAKHPIEPRGPEMPNSATSATPHVLGDSTVTPTPQGETLAANNTAAMSATQITALVQQFLARYIAQAQQGPVRPQGPPGPPGHSGLSPGFSGPNGMVQNDNGKTTAVVGGAPIVSYVPSSSNGNYTGGSLAGITTFSANSFTAGTENITSNLTGTAATFTGALTVSGQSTLATSTLSTLTVSGPATFSGSTTIAGLTVTALNPGLTQGSVAFQGAAGLTQDNSNFFYDSTNHRLGLGTTTPSQFLTVAGNSLITGNALVTGNATTSGSQIISGAFGVSGASTLATTTTTNFTASGPAMLQSTLSVTATSTLAAVTATTLTTTGNVGIGTTNPGASLDVARSSGGYPLYLENTATNSSVSLKLTNSSGGGLGQSNWDIRTNNLAINDFGAYDVVNSAYRLYIQNNGFVGIGTTAPPTKLYVAGGAVRIDDGQAYGFGASSLESYLSQSSSKLVFNNLQSSGYEFDTEGAGAAVRILDSGNVGIGTTGPTAPLHVTKGSAGIIANFENTNSNSSVGIKLINSSGGGLGQSNWNIITNANNINDFNLYDAINSAYRLTVLNSGNVGIGTTMPTLGPLTMASGAFVSSGGTWTNASDRNLKENFATMSPASILEKIDQLPVTQWDYKTEGLAVNHIGPVAQDFWTAFHLGTSSTSISTIDPAGVALLGIQALDQKIQALQGSMTANAKATSLTVYNPGNFSGDSVGEAKILSGQTSVKITFTQPYTNQPIVTLTPEDQTASGEFVTDRNSTEFTIRTSVPVTSDTTFAWHSFASLAARLTVSDGSTAPIALILSPTPAPATPAIVLPAVSASSPTPITPVTSTSTADSTASPTPSAFLGASTSTPPTTQSTTATPLVAGPPGPTPTPALVTSTPSPVASRDSPPAPPAPFETSSRSSPAQAPKPSAPSPTPGPSADQQISANK